MSAGNTNEKLIKSGTCQVAGFSVTNSSGGAATFYLVDTEGDGIDPQYSGSPYGGWRTYGSYPGYTDIIEDPIFTALIADGTTYTSPDWMSGTVFEHGLLIWSSAVVTVNTFLFEDLEKPSLDIRAPVPSERRAPAGVTNITFSGLKRPSKASPIPK